MFTLQSLPLPVLGAPMAGGPSTPELAAAVSNAGGLGFLAAGYKSPAAVREQILRTRTLTGAPFGVNLFVPEHANTYAGAPPAPAPDSRLAAALAFRELLAAGTGPEPGQPNPDDDDGWAAKLDLVLQERVPVVSFTFGLPEPAVLAELSARDICTVVTVTDGDEAQAAADAGARILCVQGPEAGGHRGTLDSAKVPGEVPLEDLLRAIAEQCEQPLVAAGGIASRPDAAAMLDSGAAAVQVGTLLLLSREAGTSPVHRSALREAVQGTRWHETSLTRAFSGRPARGLTNEFMRTYPEAPDAYPYVNQITAPLRAAAAAQGDPEGVSLWAGTGYRQVSGDDAGTIVRRLAGPLPGRAAGTEARAR